MRDDLLHSKASVDWAEAQLPPFKARLDQWINKNFDVIVIEQPTDSRYNSVVAVQKSLFPLEFHVEAGAYINAIRSSLDILAVALAYRHCKHLVDKAYFPIVGSEQSFIKGEYKRREFVEALPDRERTIIECLKPYPGGNDLLYGLHYLDIVRKHARLLNVEVRPDRLNMSGAKMNAFKPDLLGWQKSGNNETKLGLIAKDIAQPKFKLAPQISLNETQYLKRGEIITTISQFAGLANAIINLFDIE